MSLVFIECAILGKGAEVGDVQWPMAEKTKPQWSCPPLILLRAQASIQYQVGGAMEDVVVRILEKVELKNPVLIVGLPGLGNVAKLAADYLKDAIGAKQFAVIYSKYFPPQVYVNEDGIIRMVSNDLFYYKAKNSQQRDLIILVGDYQGISPEGQYELTDRVLALASKMGAKEVFTLAGFAQGHMVENPRVLGAATSKEGVNKMKKFDVVFSRSEPGSGLIGASGLFLGIGELYDMQSICLMGETSGYFVDPRSAEAVLKVLIKALSLDVDLDDLEEKAKEIDKIATRLRETEAKVAAASTPHTKEDLGYFG
jgi:hypothetical protein